MFVFVCLPRCRTAVAVNIVGIGDFYFIFCLFICVRGRVSTACESCYRLVMFVASFSQFQLGPEIRNSDFK